MFPPSTPAVFTHRQPLFFLHTGYLTKQIFPPHRQPLFFLSTVRKTNPLIERKFLPSANRGVKPSAICRGFIIPSANRGGPRLHQRFQFLGFLGLSFSFFSPHRPPFGGRTADDFGVSPTRVKAACRKIQTRAQKACGRHYRRGGKYFFWWCLLNGML
jgi:hypothetical protein